MATARPALFSAVLRPIQAFFHLEAASSILLLTATVAALVWANSPGAGAYWSLLGTELELGVGGLQTHFTLKQLINDGLMTVFFFLVGMEIKRELVSGELRTLPQAMLPFVAAIGGMVVPAGFYLLLNAGTPNASGWAIPMATDIAFAIGVLTLLRGRVPNSLIVFLTALAIFDDMGGILVIAIFYGSGIHLPWLGITAALGLVLFLMNRRYVRSGLLYAVMGGALWYALHHAGIHATLAGVALGLAIPTRPTRSAREVLVELGAYVKQLLGKPEDESLENAELLAIEERIEDLEPPLQRFVHILHPWVAFGIIPAFALVNSGISLQGVSLSSLADPVPLGIVLGLFVGKSLGIFAFTLVALRLRLGSAPTGSRLIQILGVGTVGGIGFTVAIFVAQLAFPDNPSLLDEAKLGILVGSAVSALVGFTFLRLVSGKRATAAASA